MFNVQCQFLEKKRNLKLTVFIDLYLRLEDKITNFLTNKISMIRLENIKLPEANSKMYYCNVQYVWRLTSKLA